MADLNKTRNFGIAAHIDAGKTTVTERILYYTGKIYKMGEVHEGTATMDFLQDEQERGITIQSAATTCLWPRNGIEYTCNLIDTPGHVDFTIEVERSLRVLDGAVAVFDGKEGVEAQSETVWRQADKYHVPRLCFINKMDKLGADFDYSFRSIYDRLAAPAVAVQIPIGHGSDFQGIIDLLDMRAYYFDAMELGSRVEERDIPADQVDRANQWRHELVEKAAELDEALTEKFIMEEPISADEIRAALRKGTLSLTCHPVFCGSALKYIGVQMLLNGIIDYLPNPSEVPPVQGVDLKDSSKKITRPADADAPFSALVFKVVSDAHGDLTYARVYSGRLKKGTRIINANNGKKEAVTRIYEMHAKERIARDETTAGDIVALIGLKHSSTGDTLCSAEDPVVLERMEFPDPVISMSIEPGTAADRDRLATALATISREDPSFQYSYNEETGETVMAGMGELHLDIVRTKLTRDLKIGIHVGKPRVAYRESIMRTGEARGLYKKQTGGRGQFGDVVLRVEPFTAAQAEEEGLNFSDDIAFESKIIGGAVPREFIPSVEAGCRQTAKSGVLAGYPLVGVKATLLDGSFHEVDSSQVAFEVAASMGFKDAVSAARPVLLEPIMKIVVTTPEEFVGNVTGDLSSRRGLIINQEQRGNTIIISAEVPLSEMFGYATTLRGMSQGRAAYAMEPLAYRPVPSNVASEVLAGV
jgi:elongation factor G